MLRLLLFLLCFLVYAQGTITKPTRLHRRYNSLIKSPNSAYTYSWTIDKKRISYGSSTGYLTRSTIVKNGTATQADVDSCLKKCDKTTSCTFASMIEFNNTASNSVICALYSSVVSVQKAKYTTGSTADSTVVASYSFTRTAGPKMPSLPTGATSLEQLTACSSTKATTPLFVNKMYATAGTTSTATTAYIVQHGKDIDPDDYFTALYNVVGDTGVVIAPGMYQINSTVAPKGYYQPLFNLAWDSIENSWSIGEDAIAPSSGRYVLNGATCSSFDVYDAIITHLSSKSSYPNLKTIVFVSHSRGSNTHIRYSILKGNIAGFTTRYVIANFATTTYFTTARPLAVESGCSTADEYPYQLVSDGMPRYVAEKFTDATTMFRKWAALDFYHLIGDYDTQSREGNPTPTCDQYAQGGVNRRDRNYAYWAHVNLLAGTSNDVSQYYGYANLKANTTPLTKVTFKHQACVVDKVGHDADAMFASDCGKAAIAGATLPTGAGPLMP